MGDTGGQPELMEMLPALTIGPALYLLFCKLTDQLDSCYNVSYRSPSGEATLPKMSTNSVQEMILTALASIACFKSSSASLTGLDSTSSHLLQSCNRSVAYIVGTHKDLVTEEQIAEFDEKLQQCIRPTDFFKDNLVQFSSEERMILPVDNMKGGASEIQAIQKLLEDCLKKHFEKISIPASWLVLSLCLRKREERTASLESVLQLAGELGIPEGEVMVALWFLHHYAGVLMYFPNLPELKDTVITDNQIVYDSATNLIVNTFRFQPSGSVGMAASERFKKTGQFSLEDIKKATAHVSGDYIPLEKLVKLLDHLNILSSFIPAASASLSSTAQGSSPQTNCCNMIYFMPCVLETASQEELAKWWNEASRQVSPAPVFITYKCGFVPIGVFPAVIAKLSGSADLKLKIKGIKKNRVEFQFGHDFDTLTLISHPKYYAVHIARRERAKTPTHEVCACVRSLMECTLHSVTSQMNYDFTAEHQWAFECPSHPGRQHLCEVDSNNPSPYVMCCLCDPDAPEPLDMSRQHLVWFGEVSG